MTPVTSLIFPLSPADRLRRTLQAPHKILQRADGAEYRYPKQTPFREYEIEGISLTLARAEKITDLLIATDYGAKSFLLLDPFDYTSGVGDFFTQPAPQIIGVGNGVDVMFQLVKNYGTGDAATSRVIRFPLPGSVHIQFDEVPVSEHEYEINFSAGVITLQTPPAAGVNIGAGFQFYTPCKFSEPNLTFQTLSPHAIEGRNIKFTEVIM